MNFSNNIILICNNFFKKYALVECKILHIVARVYRFGFAKYNQKKYVGLVVISFANVTNKQPEFKSHHGHFLLLIISNFSSTKNGKKMLNETHYWWHGIHNLMIGQLACLFGIDFIYSVKRLLLYII